MLSYEKALETIHSKGNFSLSAGLDRMIKLFEKLGNPQNKFKSVHIAGTNGKGSVAAMTAEVFKTAGYKTGLFTSPYIIEFRDRIRINGDFIPEQRLAAFTEKVMSKNIEVTEFEMITAIGFLYFAEEKCDVAVIETGLGGRLDATNILANPQVSVITKIGLDHTAILGDTIEKIAAEKCGIIKKSPVVTVPTQRAEALSVIKSSTERLTVPDISRLEVIKSDLSGNSFVYKGKSYETSLAGAFQIENAVTAIETVKNSGIKVSDTDLYNGIKNAVFPARLESFMSGRIVLDGAHNPDGAEVLKEAMKPFKGELTAIIGMMKDKDYEAVLSLTVPLCKRVIAVKAADMPRALSASRLAETAKKYCGDVIVADSKKAALETALGSQGKAPVFVFGSLYLASDIRPLLISL